MIFACIFTYSANSRQAIESARAVQQTFPEARVSLIDDAHFPWPVEQVKKAQELSFEYVVSHFNRNRNLNGHDAVVGILKSLVQDSPDPEDLVIKIDADTAIVGDSFIEPLLQDPELCYAFCGTPWHAAHGCAYVLRARIVYEMLESLAKVHVPGKAPEDLVIGQYAILKHKGKVYAPWGYLDFESRWTAWNWDPKTTVEYYAEHFDVVTTGNPCGKPNPDEDRAEVIRNLREAKSGK